MKYYIGHEYNNTPITNYKTLGLACSAMWSKRVCHFGEYICAFTLHDGTWNYPNVCNYASYDEYLAACKAFAKIH